MRIYYAPLESGIEVEANLWAGLYAPTGAPAAAINKLNAEIARYITEPQTNSWLMNSLGGAFAPYTPERFGAFLAADIAQWQKIIEHIGLRLA